METTHSPRIPRNQSMLAKAQGAYLASHRTSSPFTMTTKTHDRLYTALGFVLWLAVQLAGYALAAFIFFLFVSHL